MSKRLAPGESVASRLAGALLAAILGLVAVAGAYHDHAFLLEAFHVCAPAPGAPQGHEHDCLACKIAPPLSTPWAVSTPIDPGLDGRQTFTPQDFSACALLFSEPSAPRGPPLLPLA
ncbi:MAG TPA: hypothetical protein VGS03_09745 [Candidatus Polarisedimenticolia bacterium]|jgi:hypothetical protein|nr:hypothetical protein [Candidatus Polarisedimenticolia bacterium]